MLPASNLIDDKIVKNMSRDQQILYQYIHAISEGNIPQRLAIQAAGQLNHSRWLTLAKKVHMWSGAAVQADGAYQGDPARGCSDPSYACCTEERFLC